MLSSRLQSYKVKEMISIQKIKVKKMDFKLYFLLNQSGRFPLACIIGERISFHLIYSTFESHDK